MHFDASARPKSDKRDSMVPLPILDGVSPSYIWLPEGPWKSVLTFLEVRFPAVGRGTWIGRMNRGQVVDANGSRLTPDSPFRRGARVFYYRELEAETPIPFVETILYQDAHILVADKPHFLPVIPSGRFLHESLLVRLKKKTGLPHLSPFHRIDRETAGVVVFSVDPATRGAYQSLFQKREMEKTYEALARGTPRAEFPMRYRSRMVEGRPFFRMEEAEGVPNSETHIAVLRRMGDATLYALQPITGKKHQLRVHLAALGIPILNDTFYPDVQPCMEDNFAMPLKLLARSISFHDPISGTRRCFNSDRTLA
jgi:tRNA pseudouridine32 synthase/23S rRNA pseudouridine746 synthase